jgi:hypothetical protein
MSGYAANEFLGEVIVEIRHRAAGIRDEFFGRKALPGGHEGAPLCGRGVPSPGGVNRGRFVAGKRCEAWENTPDSKTKEGECTSV